MRRLQHLDSLRGIAVLLVLLQHLSDLALPRIASFSADYVQLGQMGVMVFFLCSGFIIPVSLERAGALTPFWISRFFRLYPLYWFSLAVAAIACAVGHYNAGNPLRIDDWLANVTMFQHYVGRTDAIELYWSLAWEMAFYLGISALFVVKLHRYPAQWAIAASTALIGASAVLSQAMPQVRISMGLFIFVAMLTGTVFYRWTVDQLTGRTLAGVVVLAAVCAAVLVHRGLAGRENPRARGTEEVSPMTNAWLAALVVFGVVVVAGKRGWTGPALLREAGRISYSIYLLQGLVLGIVVLPADLPGIVRATVWAGLTIGASLVTYRWVEKPAIDRGHALAKGHRPTSAERGGEAFPDAVEDIRIT